MCHSIVLCKTCNKCQKCCTKSACRGETSKLLANLAGSGCQSESCSNPERGLHPPLSDPAKSHKVYHSHKLLCQSPQEPLPAGGITSAHRQKCRGTNTKPNISGFFQPTIFSPKAQQQVETYIRSEQTESFLQGGEIQNGDTRNHQDIPPTRGVGHLNRLQGRLLPYTNTGTVQEISEISCSGSDIPIQSSAFRSVHSTLGVYCCSKGGETDGHTQGYKDPPVPRRLVGESQIPPGLSSAYSGSSKNMPRSRLAGEFGKVRTGAKQIFDFVGYQFDLWAGRVRWQYLQDKILEILSLLACPVRQFISLIGLLTATEKQVHLGRLHMRPIQWHLKNNWRLSESLEKVISIPRSLHPHLQWWLSEDNILTGQPLHPIKHALQIFTDASKEGGGGGAQLNEHTARGSWSLPESKLHINYVELKALFLALKEFQDLCTDKIVLVATYNTTVVSYINKEGGMKSGPLCVLLWRILTWCTRKQVTLKARHIPGRLNVVADKLSRVGQTIQTVVSPSRGLPNNMQQVASASNRPICHKVQQQVASFCVTCTGFPGHSSGCTLPWEDLDAYAFQPAAILGKVVEKLQDTPYKSIILIAPGWPNMPWFWDLVTMSSQIPLSLPNLPNLLTQPFNQILHRNLTSLNLHAWLLEPQQLRSRASLKQWQQELRLLKEDRPDQSMRQSGPFLQSGASLIMWTSGHPPVKSVADFLMYLFQDRKLQPSTIDGYRSAIADKLGNSPLNISKDENLTHLLDSFHRDRPKGRRGIPSWNPSLVLHQLTKAPFEPIKEASLKHLTFKTVFLLALGSGKHRSEIHAWQNRNIRYMY